jgi:hypothetical protein
MKKKLYLLTTILAGTAALLLSSCLKDKSHYVNFDTGQTFVDFPKGGMSGFGPQAITEAPPDTLANGQPNDLEAITRQFAVNVASQNLPTSPTTVTLAVDTTLTAVLNNAQTAVKYLTMPADAYKFTGTKVTIPAGQQYANTSVTFYKANLDPSKSYVLPIVIKDGGGKKISANLNVLYYHFIGNDFAGIYNQDFHRWNAADTTDATTYSGLSFNDQPTTIYPVTPTQFEVYSGYAGGIFRYEVTFTKTGLGASAMYSDFSVVINSDDAAAYAAPPNYINIAIPAKFEPIDNASLAGPFTYQQAIAHFSFYFTVANGAAAPFTTRAITDRYYK